MRGWAASYSCRQNSGSGADEAIVRFETTLGDFTVKLYNETPVHRDNFLKLARDGFYDSVLFHRVIASFMVQAGDPESRRASDTAYLGMTDIGYALPAEFREGLYHKRGALAAAARVTTSTPRENLRAASFIS